MFFKIEKQSDLFKVEIVYQNYHFTDLQQAIYRAENYKSLDTINRFYSDRVEYEHRLIVYSKKLHVGYVLMFEKPSEISNYVRYDDLYDTILREQLNKIDIETLVSWLDENIEQFDKFLTSANDKQNPKMEEDKLYLRNMLNSLDKKNNYFIKEENKRLAKQKAQQEEKIKNLKKELREEEEELEKIKNNIK